MDVLGDAIRRDRRSDRPALRAPAVGRSYDYRRFCTSAWKTGHLLRHLGVRRGATVVIADRPAPEAVISFYGAALLGAVVQFGPTADVSDDVRVLVVPESELARRDVGAGTNCVAYGGEPSDPTVAYFERDVWSENPTEPPDSVAPDDPLLRAPGTRYSHGDVLEAAVAVLESYGIDSGDQVAVHGSLRNPDVVVAGLVGPLVAGGTIVLGAGSDRDVVVGGSDSDVDVGTPLVDGST